MTVSVAVIQPNFMPWLGYFDMMRRADLFVFYDDVQFSRKGYANRNHMRDPKNQSTWLSVPTLHGGGKKGDGFLMLNELPLTTHGDLWQETMPNKLDNWYRNAPHVEQYVEEFRDLIAEDYESLADLNIAVIEWMAHHLGITTPTLRVSGMEISKDLDRTYRPLAICQRLGAEVFISGPTARQYVSEIQFSRAGVTIEWSDFSENHPVYPQHREPFIPYLSALDFLIETGPGWGPLPYE